VSSVREPVAGGPYPDRVDVINELYYWTDMVLFYGLLALRAWALIDCLTRRNDAFPAVDKLTKAAWAAMLALGLVFGSLIFRSPLSIFSLITAVMAAVYLADVRPAVREISGPR
jgi:hypothetical protein